MSVQTNPVPGLIGQYTPKLYTQLRGGYGRRAFGADALAGLTVAIVALPLSMAIAIASGLGPERGLFTACVGGFVISALGGSRFQIGGPAGAFIVLIAGIVERSGYQGLALATIMAGAIMVAAGFLKLGGLVKYVPMAVTVGFTSGIAVIIFASQLHELLGLELAREPAALVPKLEALYAAFGSRHLEAIAVSAFSIAIIAAFRHWRPHWPAMLIAVAAGAILALALHLDVATIGSRFGAIPNRLPAPSWPAADINSAIALLPDAFSIALLGAIESLLCAVVADRMGGGAHRSNGELVAQGAANIAAVAFGGMPVTGAIARTATNVRAGARSPVAGIAHALYILIFMFAAAPLASYIPLASLGAVLAVVAWNMAERHAFFALLRRANGETAALLATFLLTIFRDLTLGISVGIAISAAFYVAANGWRLADAPGD